MQRRVLLPNFSAPYIKASVPEFLSEGVEMTEKEAEVGRTSE